MRNRQVVRQLSILRRLATARAAITYYELAQAFHVSARTIRRDFAAIQEAGFPLVDVEVDAEAGRLGWRLMESREVSRLVSIDA
jgi:predicted DNA-binding transcriptional regulator YafY